MYVIGKTGMGKTAMLQNMAIQDIKNGKGLGVIDPHGEFAEALLKHIPEERIDDVVYLNPADYDAPIGLNLLEDVGYDRRHLVASGLMGVFKKIWVDVWSARMEYILNNTILALLEYPEATLLDINRMMSNKNFRKEVLNYVKDPIVKAFWVDEFAQYSDRLASEATASIQNKVGQFTTAPLIRNIVGQKDSTIDFRKIMDEGKILIVNISKGRIGEDNSRLLGAMVITKLYLSAMSRIDIPESERRDFYLYVDEFQNFASEAFEGILSEARKYRLALILAHQYIFQMEEHVRNAVFGNVGTFCVFRVGAEDAEYIEKEFAPEYIVEDFVHLAKYNIILKLMIDGVASHAFSAITLPPIEMEGPSHTAEIIKKSRETYGTPREKMEKIIESWGYNTPRQEIPQRAPERFVSLKQEHKKYTHGGAGVSPSQHTVRTPGEGSAGSLVPPRPATRDTAPGPSRQGLAEEDGTPKGYEADTPVPPKSASSPRDEKQPPHKKSKGPDLEGLREILGSINKGN